MSLNCYEGVFESNGDEEIAKCLERVLRQSNPNTRTTLNDVVEQVEAKLGLDLSQKAGFIRDQINYLRPRLPPPPQIPPLKDHFTLHHYHPQFPNTHPQFRPHFAPPPLRPDYNLNFPQPQAAANVVENVKPSVAVVPKESAPAKRRGRPGGLNKLCGVTPELQVIVGEPALARTEIVKQLWAYIKKNNLQDPSNKRKIICDDALRVVFETDCTDMFKMNKLLSKHIVRLEPKVAEESGRAKKLKVEVDSPAEITEPVHLPPHVIMSEVLANFFATGEREISQSEVSMRIWEYIQVNNLEDPWDPMVILCDAKLRQLLGCESISALGIPEMLVRHHLFKR